MLHLHKDCLFQKFYLSHPEVTSHKGEDIAEILLSAVGNTLGWSIRKLREQLCGGSFDGQYINLNVPDHLAKKLSLEKEFTKETITWDIAHRVVLGSDGTKKQTNWLQELQDNEEIYHGEAPYAALTQHWKWI